MSGPLEDKVASSLGNGNPSGTEVKLGESTVVSHRPNEMSKHPAESAPVVPNDVIQSAPEPAVGQQNGHADKPEEKTEAPKLEGPKGVEKKETNGTNGTDAKAGEKRKADGKVDAPPVPAESAALPATESEPKKQKTADGTEKKKPGRPKGPGVPKKEKKEPRIGQALRKTRSQGTA